MEVIFRIEEPFWFSLAAEYREGVLHNTGREYEKPEFIEKMIEKWEKESGCQFETLRELYDVRQGGCVIPDEIVLSVIKRRNNDPFWKDEQSKIAKRKEEKFLESFGLNKNINITKSKKTQRKNTPNENNRNELSGMLNQISKTTGMSMHQIANKLGVAEMTVYNWSKGKTYPSKTNKTKLEKLFETTTQQEGGSKE